MNETVTPTYSLTSGIYKNAKMGSDSIINLLPKVTDSKLKTELTRELDEYEGFATKAKKMIEQEGKEAHDEGMMAKLGSKVGIAFNTMKDPSNSHIAEMMIEGATMAVTDTTKLLREYENTSASSSSISLARDVITFAENSIETLKSYL